MIEMMIDIRVKTCSSCAVLTCPHKADLAFQNDPCGRCPKGYWRRFGCQPGDAPAAKPKGLEPTWSLLRRVRSYRQAGYLIGLLEFLRRRAACSTCERRTTRATHRGLYGCGACSVCAGGPERMLVTASVCPLKKWPTGPGPRLP